MEEEFKGELVVPSVEKKRPYKLSRKAILQRQTNAMKEGSSSIILAKLSSCYNCSFRNYCQEMPKMSEEDKLRGCQEIRQAFIAVLHELTANPESFIAKDIANISIELDFQTIKDGSKESFSKERFRLFKIKERLMELLLRYRDTRAKYTRGTMHTTIVKHMDSNETFDVPKANVPNKTGD